MSRETEVPTIAEMGDVAIDCGVSELVDGAIWVTIRDGGNNTLICVTLANALRFSEQLRYAVDEAA